MKLYKFDKVQQFKQEINQLKQLSSKNRSKSTLDATPSSDAAVVPKNQYKTINDSREEVSEFSIHKSTIEYSRKPPKVGQKHKSEKGCQTEGASEDRLSGIQRQITELVDQKVEILQKIERAQEEIKELRKENKQLKASGGRDARREFEEKEKFYQMNIE